MSSSQNGNVSRGGIGSLGLVALISGVFAYAATPAISSAGLKGVFAAAMVGSGTSLLTNLAIFGGALAGGIVVGALTRSRTGMNVGGIACAIAAGVAAVLPAYSLSHDIVNNGMTERAAITEPAPQGLAAPALPQLVQIAPR